MKTPKGLIGYGEKAVFVRVGLADGYLAAGVCQPSIRFLKTDMELANTEWVGSSDNVEGGSIISMMTPRKFG